MTQNHLWVSDLDIAQDIFVSKNAILDKVPDAYLLFHKLLGESFVFSPTNNNWKDKRKACAHAFFKDRL